MQLVIAVLVLLISTAARGQLQVSAQYDVETQEQQQAAVNTQALGTAISGGLAEVYGAAGLPPESGGAVLVGGALVSPPAPAPPPPPSPAPTPPPPPATGNSGGGGEVNTWLVVAALVISVVGVGGVVVWYCVRKGSKEKVKLPPEIPYKIRPQPSPQPQPQPQPQPPSQPRPQPPPIYYSPPPQPAYYAQPPPQQPAYYAQPPPQQPDYYAPPQQQQERKVWIPI